MMGVPANYLLMAEEPGSRRPTSLRCGSRSSAARRCRCRCSTPWAERGVEIVQGYGLTEAAPNVLCLPPEDARRKAGSAGKPYPYVECRLSADGRAARPRAERLRRLLAQPRGDRGGVPRRLAAHRRRRRARRGGQLLAPRADQGARRLGRRERLPGRGRGGAARPPGGGRGGGRRRAGRALGRGLRRLRRDRGDAGRRGPSCAAFCAERLARFKVPKAFHVVDALPRNSVGKVLKSELAAARDRRDHQRERAAAVAARARHAAAAARRGRARLRRARLPGRVDREDHRGGRGRRREPSTSTSTRRRRSSTSSSAT